MTLELPRRNFLRGLAGLIAAPAIVPYKALMPIKSMPEELNEFSLENMLVEAHERYAFAYTDWRLAWGHTRDSLLPGVQNWVSTYKKWPEFWPELFEDTERLTLGS